MVNLGNIILEFDIAGTYKRSRTKAVIIVELATIYIKLRMGAATVDLNNGTAIITEIMVDFGVFQSYCNIGIAYSPDNTAAIVSRR